MRCAAALLCAVLCCTLRCMGVAMGGAQRLLFGAWLLLNFIQHAALISEYHKHFKLFHCSAKKVWMQSVTSSGQWKGEREERRVKRRECKSISIEFNRIECLAFCWQLWVMQLNSIANSLLDTASTRRPLTHSVAHPAVSDQCPPNHPLGARWRLNQVNYYSSHTHTHAALPQIAFKIASAGWWRGRGGSWVRRRGNWGRHCLLFLTIWLAA